MRYFSFLSFLVAAFVFSCGQPKPSETPQNEVRAAAYRPPTIRLKHRGVNLSGGEFGTIPGVYGQDYGYPKNEDVDYFVSQGMNFFRIGMRHERLQPKLKCPLDEAEFERLNALVTYATSKGITVALEPHNSWRHFDKIITEEEAGWFWGLLGQRYKDNPRVWFNLTNEPHDMSTEVVVALSNASLKELRRIGYKNMVLVPGGGWTGASHWNSNWYGTSNSIAMLKVVDPINNYAIEVHQYVDADSSGGGTECVSETIGVERLTNFVAWLRTNKRIGFLGELGAPNTPKCKAAITKMLNYVEEQYDVWVGWTVWAAGSRWTPTYPLSLQPVDGVEKPQMSWYRPFLPCGR